MPRAMTRRDWQHWLERWDAQQEAFNPEREHRFATMLDVLEASVGRRFTVLDLGSGPGSLSARIVRRFPAARAVAVDYDPVVREIGEHALGTVGGRLTWVDAKLGARGWREHLPRRRYDAAVSTTALHWLTPWELSQLYLDLGRLLRPGGVFLNGDHLPWGSTQPELHRLGRKVLSTRFRARRRGWGAWRRWWREARRVPALSEAFREHDRRGASHPHRDDLSLDAHERRLRRARFRTVGVVWQDVENRVLYARR